MEQKRVKRKSSSDGLQINKKWREAENETLASSLSSTLSSNSDDYGTDTELIAINQLNNKHKILHR